MLVLIKDPGSSLTSRQPFFRWRRKTLSLYVLVAVQYSVDLPVIIRISGDEMIPDGIHLEEMIEFAKILGKKGVAAIHVSAGSVCSTPHWGFQHMFTQKGKTWDLAQAIKSEINIPVIYVGQINTFDDIELLKDRYKVEYISLGRALVAYPDFAFKYLHGKNIYKPCVACSDVCLGRVKSGHGPEDAVNPLLGTEEKNTEIGKQKLDLAIMGGGLTGSESALVQAKIGHRVTLFEKDRIGRQFRLAYLLPKKDSLKKLVDYYEKTLQILKNSIKYPLHPDQFQHILLPSLFNTCVLV
jgi:2,4-dienoyl-CoA reductase (NADPH2)